MNEFNIEQYENKHVLGHYKDNIYYFNRKNIIRHVKKEIATKVSYWNCTPGDDYMYATFMGYEKYFWLLPYDLLESVFHSIYPSEMKYDMIYLFSFATQIQKEKIKQYTWVDLNSYLLLELEDSTYELVKYSHLITLSPEQLLHEDLKSVCNDLLLDYDYLITNINEFIIDMDEDEKRINEQRGESNA